MKIEEFKYFYPEKPRLANIEQELVTRLSKDQNWVAEKKYNENRLQLHYINGKFQFWNRHEEQLQYSPNEALRIALNALPLKGYCLFDGGLRHNKTKGVRHKIMFYDVFIWNNKLLIDKPFWYRRHIVEKLVEIGGDPLGTPDWYEHSFVDWFHAVIEEDEIEGLVLKDLRGKLRLGRTAAHESKWMWKLREPSGRYRF